MTNKTWSNDNNFINADSNIDVSGNGVRFGYGDEFTRSVAENLLTGGDGSKQNNANLLQSAKLTTSDIDSTQSGELYWTHTTDSDWYTTTENNPHWYKQVPGDKDWELITEVTNSNGYVSDELAGIGVRWTGGGLSGNNNMRVQYGHSTLSPAGMQVIWIGNANSSNVILTNTNTTGSGWFYLRLVKSGSNFYAYAKKNIGDSWTQVSTAYTNSNFNNSSVTANIGLLTTRTGSNVTLRVPYFRVTGVDGTGTVEVDAIEEANLQTFTFSSFSATTANTDGNNTVLYQYKIKNTSSTWGAYNGTWLTEAQVAALSDTLGYGLQFKIQFSCDGSGENPELQQMSIEYFQDITPPGSPTNVKHYNFNNSNNYAISFDQPSDNDYSHSEMRVDIDATSNYLQNDGTFSTGVINLMKLTGQGNSNDNDSTPADGFIAHNVSGGTLNFYIRSVDTSGNASSWAQSTFESGAADPDKPGPSKIISALDLGTGGAISVTIDPPGDTDYNKTILYSLSTNGAFDSVIGSMTSTETTVSISGLTNNQLYKIIAISQDDSGNFGLPSNCASVVPTDGSASPFKKLYDLILIDLKLVNDLTLVEKKVNALPNRPNIYANLFPINNKEERIDSGSKSIEYIFILQFQIRNKNYSDQIETVTKLIDDCQQILDTKVYESIDGHFDTITETTDFNISQPALPGYESFGMGLRIICKVIEQI